MKMHKIKLVEDDGWLEPYEGAIRTRRDRYETVRADLDRYAGGLVNYASTHLYQGLQQMQDGRVSFREWAPQAQALFLTGDFNDWSRESHPLTRGKDGVWECFLDPGQLQAGQFYKVHVVSSHCEGLDRIPSHARRVIQDPHSHDFCAEVSFSARTSSTQVSRLALRDHGAPLIYEAHIGMAGEEARVHRYREFADEVIPHIVASGYNTIQLMAIAEHPYYGSFGYHVSNFFAPSSRFGTEEDLRYLVKVAHEAGLAVLMDLVHSHAVKNIAEGLNDFDGSGGHYFHDDERGEHPQWDSKCFDYGNPQVRQFLLSNLRYWLEEFGFDGFRFDGVTSMLYWHRGTVPFDGYEKYFDEGVDEDAILYLQLATTLIREIKADALIIAEDMSGMPGLCRPVAEGGVGFTHRLAMGIPDYWIKLLKEKRDEDWNLADIFHTLANRRHNEPTIAYAESHDQALVGDKTLAFRLMDADMYWHMTREEDHPAITRGIALHKLIRVLTLVLGGEGYLTFMGNEFGHPEWIDFPRVGNDWSYQHCRRQWSLMRDEKLRYGELLRFDQALVALSRESAILAAPPATLLHHHEEELVLIAERGEVVFAMNLHPTRYYDFYPITPSRCGNYEPVLNSDEKRFGGYDQTKPCSVSSTQKERTFRIPLPPRSVQVFRLISS